MKLLKMFYILFILTIFIILFLVQHYLNRLQIDLFIYLSIHLFIYITIIY